MNNKNLRITETDVLGIKQNLISYFKTQNEFTGYNFEGSAINVLLDILSYNTYYNSFYNNMTINEMFMDSANKRSSIVSLAKHFGYTPKTITASSCTIQVDIEIGLSSSNNFYLPKYTSFAANKDGEQFEFLLMEDSYFTATSTKTINNETTITKTSGSILLKQGRLKTFTYIYDLNNTTQKFVIPYENVDSTTLVVKVQPDPSSSIEELYTIAKNITEISETSKVFFLEENPDGYLEIFFGDGILGTKLKDSSIIRIEILQTDGEQANGIGTINSTEIFSISSGDFQRINEDNNAPIVFEDLSVIVIQPSYGGSPKEEKTNIRFNATRNFTTAERAVTKTDYRNIVLKDNPQIQDVIIWGGEENSPPDYGKVFISAKPIAGSSLSTIEKNNLIQNLTTRRNVVGVQVELVDPNVIYLNLNVSVKIDPVVINRTTNVKTEVRKTIDDFFSQFVRKFDADFYSAELIEQIQDIDESIISNDISVILEKRFTPNFIASQNYIFEFDNSFFTPFTGYSYILTSNLFGYLDSNQLDRDCQLEDDGVGNVMLFYKLGNKKIYINKKIGTIDYKKGRIVLNNFKPSFLINNYPITLYVIPENKDIIASKKTVLEFDTNSINSLKIQEELIPYRNK
jgi:hypothetical protein